MTISDSTKTDRLFKESQDRRMTSTDKAFYEETAANLRVLQGKEVWLENIDSDPATAVAAGTVWMQSGWLHEDISVNNEQAWFASGTGDSSGYWKGWVPPKVGQGYTISIYESGSAGSGPGTKLGTTDAIDWVFDYQEGMFWAQDSCTGKTTPFYISGYRYSGALTTKEQFDEWYQASGTGGGSAWSGATDFYGFSSNALTLYGDSGVHTTFTPRIEWNQNGFENRTDSTLAWTDSGPDRTLSIQPVATSFDYWISGTKHTSTGDTHQIADTMGIHAIYYDGGSLTSAANPSLGAVDSVIRTKAIAAYVYWNKSSQTAIYVGEERHGKDMAPDTHAYLHFVRGLAYYTGLGLVNISSNQDGDDDCDAQVGVSAGAVADEDLYLTQSAVNSTTGIPVYYMSGNAPGWYKRTTIGFPVMSSNSADGRLVYNENTGGDSWKLTEVTNADFVLYHIFVTTEKDTPIISIMGQSEYANAGTARNAALTEIRSLVLDDVLFPEIHPLGTVIYQTRDSYDNAVHARIRQTDEGDDYVDWRSETIERVSISTTDHGSLTGLSDDDHTQYHTDARGDVRYPASGLVNKTYIDAVSSNATNAQNWVLNTYSGATESLITSHTSQMSSNALNAYNWTNASSQRYEDLLGSGNKYTSAYISTSTGVFALASHTHDLSGSSWSGAAGYIGHSSNTGVHFPSSSIRPWLDAKYKGTGATYAIEDLTDVAEMAPADNQVLSWDNDNSYWSSQTVSASDVAWSGAAGFYTISSSVNPRWVSSQAISGGTITFNTFAGQTDATAAEIEELTDSSETTLHSHAASESWSGATGYIGHSSNVDIHYASSNILNWLNGEYQQSGTQGGISSWYDLSAGTGVTPFGGSVSVSGTQAETLSILGYATISANATIAKSGAKYTSAYLSGQRVKDLFNHNFYSLSSNLYNQTWISTFSSNIISKLGGYIPSTTMVNKSDNDVLTWDSANNMWSSATATAVVASIEDITDVADMTSKSDNDILVWDAGNAFWSSQSAGTEANYNAGWALVSSQSTITHNFGTTPTIVGISPSGTDTFSYSVSYDATNITVYLSVEGKHCVNWFAGGPSTGNDLDFYVQPQGVEVVRDGSNILYFSGQNGTYVYSGNNTIIISSATAVGGTYLDNVSSNAIAAYNFSANSALVKTGFAQKSSEGTIAHGLGSIPTHVSVTPSGMSTNFGVNCKVDVNNITVYMTAPGTRDLFWQASV